MAGAFLLRLLDESDPGRPGHPRHRLSHIIGLVPHHHEDALRRRQLQGGLHHVLDQRFAARAVQHLGLARFHARAEPGGEYHNCNGNPH